MCLKKVEAFCGEAMMDKRSLSRRIKLPSGIAIKSPRSTAQIKISLFVWEPIWLTGMLFK